MPYLVCDRCGGSYELRKGESPDDFTDKCECGGTLKFVQNLEDDNESQKVCPNCGNILDDNDEVCSNCCFELNKQLFTEKQLIIKFLIFLVNIGIIIIMTIFFGGVLWESILVSIFKPQPEISIYSIIGLTYLLLLLLHAL